MTDSGGDVLKFADIKRNYQILLSKYRKGNLEDEIKFNKAGESLPEPLAGAANLSKINQADRPGDDIFVVRNADLKKNNFPQGTNTLLLLREASILLYQQITDFEIENKSNLAAEELFFIFEVKSLLYECLDYLLFTPEKLKKTFLGLADDVLSAIRNDLLSDYIRDNYKVDEAAMPELFKKVQSKLLIGILFGINEHYRTHTDAAYAKGAEQLEELLPFIERKYQKRPPLSLLGLFYFLKGQIKRATLGYQEAEEAFQLSLRYYSERVVVNDNRRNNDNLRNKNLLNKLSAESSGLDEDDLRSADERYNERQQLALRRASLVSGMGLGYLYLINSKLSDAEKSLILARAVARQNSSKLYITYIDLIYFSVLRAKYSFDPGKMKLIIKGLKNCRRIYLKLCPDTHYRFRTHIELALAYHYFVQHKPSVTENARLKYYKIIEKLLNQAVDFASGTGKNPAPNTRLLAEALYIRSHIRRLKPNPDIKESLEDAERSYELVFDKIKQLEADVIIALGSWHLEEAEFGASDRSETSFESARMYFQLALKRNAESNFRITAICNLRLAKLFRLKPDTYQFAYYCYSKYKEIESEVEHGYVKDSAAQLEKTLMSSDRVFFVESSGTLKLKERQKELSDFLVNASINKLVESLPSPLNHNDLKNKIVKQLTDELEISKSQAYDLIKESKLENKVIKLHRILKGD